MKPFKHLCLILFTGILITGCGDSRIIKEEKFVEIYCDLVIMKDTLDTDFNGFNRAKMEMLSRYRVNSNQFEATLRYYNSDPERWNIFFEKALKRMDELKSKSKSQ